VLPSGFSPSLSPSLLRWCRDIEDHLTFGHPSGQQTTRGQLNRHNSELRVCCAADIGGLFQLDSQPIGAEQRSFQCNSSNLGAYSRAIKP
jgi:hypothetical protein